MIGLEKNGISLEVRAKIWRRTHNERDIYSVTQTLRLKKQMIIYMQQSGTYTPKLLLRYKETLRGSQQNEVLEV